MRDSKRKRSEGSGESSTSTGSKGAGDSGSAKLAKLSKAIGNEEMTKRLAKGNASRDQMLDFLCKRLQNIKSAQDLELERIIPGRRFPDWRLISDKQKEEFTKPEPMRWRESARLYERASDALCSGNLGRGAELLKAAYREEQRQFNNFPKQIDDRELDKEETLPGSAAGVITAAACGECEEPAGVELARDIQDVSTDKADAPTRRRTRDPWWTDREEEEEEESDGDGG